MDERDARFISQAHLSFLQALAYALAVLDSKQPDSQPMKHFLRELSHALEPERLSVPDDLPSDQFYAIHQKWMRDLEWYARHYQT